MFNVWALFLVVAFSVVVVASLLCKFYFHFVFFFFIVGTSSLGPFEISFYNFIALEMDKRRKLNKSSKEIKTHKK